MRLILLEFPLSQLHIFENCEKCKVSSELFDAIFPNYAARQQFDEMRSAVATLADAIKTQRLPVDVECEVLCAIVKARRAVQAKLGGE